MDIGRVDMQMAKNIEHEMGTIEGLHREIK